MGGGGGTKKATPGETVRQGPSPGRVSTEYEANRPQMMPVYNSPAQIESARRKREELLARSGRTATNLVGNPGTRSFQNSFLGSVT